MKKVISLMLLIALVFSLTACGGKEQPVEENEQQTAARTEFQESLKTVYSSANAFVLKQYVIGSDVQIEALSDDNDDLLEASVKNIASQTLFTEGDYTVYDVILYIEISATGERRVYHDQLLTKQDSGTTKLVPQITVTKEVQQTIIDKIIGMKNSIEKFEKDSIKAFTKESKSFASWYEKRKDSLKINTSGFCLKMEPVVNVSPIELDNRVLVWSEEFEGNISKIEDTKLSHNNGMAMKADDLLQTKDGSNITFADGVMTMTARPYPDKSKYLYQTSQAVTTQNKMHFSGGYIEMRAKVPFEKGAWPSFWMKSVKNSADWMSEIDIFEIFATENNVVSAIHKWGDDGHVSRSAGNYLHPSNEVATDWHTYGLDWTEEYLRFYVDDICYSEVPITDADDYNIEVPGMEGHRDLHFVLLNNFIFTTGGNQNYVRQNLHLTKDDTKTITYQVDYIRLYQNPEKDRIVIY